MFRKARLLSVMGFLLAFPRDAAAHVKWFFPYDLGKPPLPIGQVITEQFTYMFLLSTACIYAFYWIDPFL